MKKVEGNLRAQGPWRHLPERLPWERRRGCRRVARGACPNNSAGRRAGLTREGPNAREHAGGPGRFPIATALIVAWVLAAALLYLPTSAWGQIQEQRLKSFGFASQSGGMPNSLVLGADGALYGTTTGGGSNSVGTIFKLNPDGTGYVQLHSFGGDATDGSVPTGLIQGMDGSLFGTTSEGGDLNGGTVFRLNTNGASYRVLYSFGGDPDGGDPQGLLQAADGWLYGTCKSGGSTWNGKGTVFKLAATGAGFSIIWEFVNPAVEGANPEGALVQGRDGALYGTTYYGGANSVGTVFKLSTNGATQSVLHSFSSAGADGCYPVAGLVQGQDGALYGTAQTGGTNDNGIVFVLGTNGTGYSVLHHFSATLGDGGVPSASLLQGADGWLYGTTVLGGSRKSAGTVFKLSGSGAGYRVLYRFSVDVISADGQRPGSALVQSKAGALYGTTALGGSTGDGNNVLGDGTVFTVGTNGGGYTRIYSFNLTGGDGAAPYASLIRGRDGALYGTTEDGGAQGAGTVFRLDPDGTGYTVLSSFGASPIDGQHPQAPLFQGADGALYGTTSDGGYLYEGTLFRLNPDGTGTVTLHSFGFLLGVDGANPQSGLIQGADGDLYGTTPYGGGSDNGTIFKISTDGARYSTVYDFADEPNGAQPRAALLLGTDGWFYGTTYFGGASNIGGVYKVRTDGTGYTVLHSFGDQSDPYPRLTTALVQGPDGYLYGSTPSGGSNYNGTVFKLNINGGGYSILHAFREGSVGDGQTPNAVAFGQDGALYGTTVYGGTNGYNDFGQGAGILFTLNPDGSGYTVLHHFGAGADGLNPQAGLMQGADGAWYGTTSAGGDLNLGTVFRFGLNPFRFTSISRLADKTVLLSLSGSTNTHCRIDVSTNLVHWDPLTNLPDQTGTVQFHDLAAPDFPRRFYRAAQAP